MSKYKANLDAKVGQYPKRENNSTKLITVHGTGAGDTTAKGDRWWQLGSQFSLMLAERLDLDGACVEIVPFQWDDGPNSEAQRRIAGQKLFSKMQRYEANGTDYYVVGHSHGGSVIYQALLSAAKQNLSLNHMRQWCTVGTPFLHYEPNRRLWQRLSATGLTFLLSGIVAWLIASSYLIAKNFTDWTTSLTQDEFLSSFTVILALYGLVCTLLLIFWERRKAGWATEVQRDRVARVFSDRWLGLWHLEDEAISALVNVKKATGPIVPKSFLEPVAAGAQFAIVCASGLWVAVDTINNGTILEVLADGFHSTAAIFVSGKQSQDLVLFFLVCCAIVLVSSLILLGAWVLKKALFIIGIPLSAGVNRIIWLSVRERAWGDDLDKEHVRSVAAHPPVFTRRFEHLPDHVAAPLREHSDNNAINTLNKVRLILGMSRNSGASSDIKTELAESLKWKELIHTSYFDVPEFIDVLAYGLSQAGLAPVIEKSSASSLEQNMTIDWLSATKT
jgi:hypothetical protein